MSALIQPQFPEIAVQPVRRFWIVAGGGRLMAGMAGRGSARGRRCGQERVACVQGFGDGSERVRDQGAGRSKTKSRQSSRVRNMVHGAGREAACTCFLASCFRSKM
jgi:hypothetical protein